MEKKTDAGKRPAFRNSRERQKWRSDLAEYAATHGVSAAAREFGTTRKTARLWMNRLQAETTKPERPVSRTMSEKSKQEKEIVPEKQTRLKMVRRSSAIPNMRKTELLELNRDIVPVFNSRVRERKIFAGDSRELPPRQTQYAYENDAVSRVLQFDCLPLGEFPQLSDYSRTGRLPEWQLTAIDSASGAAWVSFCHELNVKAAARFMKDLVSHLKNNGVNPERIHAAVNPDSELGKLINLPGGEDFVFPAGQAFAGYHEGNLAELNLKHTSAEFHRRQIRELYSNPVPSSSKKFIDAVHAFMLRAGYEKKPDGGSVMPPYQTLCRLENGYCREDVLNYRPHILDFPRRKKASQGAGVMGLFGSMASAVKTVFTRSKVENKRPARPTGEKPPKPITIPPSNPDKTGAKNAEFMNLRNVNWKNAPARQSETSVPDRRQRNRREIIEQARTMLAQRAGDDELKNALPITDGELAMVKQNMGVTK